MATTKVRTVNQTDGNRGLLLGIFILLLLLLLLVLGFISYYFKWWPWNMKNGTFNSVAPTYQAPGSGSGATGQPGGSGSSGSSGSSGANGTTGAPGNNGNTNPTTNPTSATTTSPIISFSAGIANGQTKEQIDGKASGLSENCTVTVTSTTAGKQEVCTYRDGSKVVTVTYANDQAVNINRTGF